MRDVQLDRIPPARIDRNHLARFLGRPGPFDLEIGCGAGWHPLQRALHSPERNLIAIERTVEKFRSFESRIRRHPPLPNLHPLHADATAVLAHDLPRELFETVFLLYPNPEPKNPAQRWIRRPFFKKIIESLRPEGRVVFATNENSYFEELIIHGPTTWGLKPISSRQIRRDEAAQARTHFEKKYLERGETCHEVIFAR